MEINEKNKDYIFVHSNSEFIKIQLSDIIYIQAEGDYVDIYTTEKDKGYTVHCTLKNMEEKLPESRFYRLSRSCLVALDHIDKIKDNKAYIKKIYLLIGEQYKKELLERLNLV